MIWSQVASGRPRLEAIEPLLDRTDPLHWLVAAVLFVSGVAAAWIGVRDGLLRREMRTSGGLLTGGKAALAGVLYVATGLAGVIGGIAFLLRD